MSQRRVLLAVLTLGCLGAACGETDPQGDTSGPGSSSGEASSGTATTGPTTTDTPTTDATTSAAETTSGASGDAGTTTDPTSTTSPTDATSTTTDATTGTGTGAVDCGDGSLGAGEHTVEVEHDGVTRTALVHIPASVDLGAPAPLVLNFHGFTSNSAQQSQFSNMNVTADAEGFIVAYPQGIDTSWNAGACCGNAMTQQVDDVGFVRKLVDALEQQLCIDGKRVYATGMSNGGFMSHRLACEASDVFAAVAPVSAVNGMADCAPGRPVPVMMFNGTADILVAYNGGGNFDKSAPETFEEWADRDGCSDDAVPGKMAGLAACESHEACDAGVSVAFCTFQGMGHCWPGQAICPYGASSTDLSANDEMWAFFSKYTLP
ncbi:MAG TPA: PHB depolymerase family esterase [Nannocystis sp.]|jgi:polyhydroxybutyrate depolymerase